MIKLFLLAASLLLVQHASPALAQVEEGFYYKLSTQFRGDRMKLDVFNGGAKNNLTRLQADRSVTGQLWRFSSNSDGTFRMTTLFRGSNMCLDIFNGGPNDNQPHLTACANVTGQSWNVTKDGNFVRLTTKFRGPDMCLDIFNGGPNNDQPHLASCTNASGQHWKLTRTDRPVAGASRDALRLITVRRTATFGGPGGGNFEISCPFGSVMTGILARHGAWIDALSPICSRYVRGVQSTGEIEQQPFTGGSGGGPGFIRCQPPRGVVVGLELFQADNRWGSVGHIIVNCGDYVDPSRFANKLPGSADFLGNSQRGRRQILKCSPPLVAGGIIGKSGIFIDRLGLTCVDYRPR